VLRRFWTSMARDDLESASAVLRDDTAYWLADLPPGSGREERPEA
jgi:ketosteroid isomerase-like protein